MKINNLDFDEHKLWRPVESSLDRFGFEVLPDGAALDDDSLCGSKLLKTVLALVVIAALWPFGLKLYERLENFSFTAMLEKRIEKPSAESETWALSPIVSGPLMELEPATGAKPEPSQQPLKRLLNSGGTMRASFPMPPDSPPEDYYVPGREVPVSRPEAQVLAGFDPDQEAYDPSSESALPGQRAASVSNLAVPRASIGEYEIFDPERDLKLSDGEIFDNPRP